MRLLLGRSARKALAQAQVVSKATPGGSHFSRAQSFRGIACATVRIAFD